MMGLSNSEIIWTIYSAVLMQCTRVTDGQTDGIDMALYMYALQHAGARKNRLYRRYRAEV